MLFTLLPQIFSVCKLAPESSTDGVCNTFMDKAQQFVFIAKTDKELSIVCETAAVPQGILSVKHGWKALRISGELDFSLVGILADITGLLAKHHISIFAISTYLTDYILVQQDTLEKTLTVLHQNGHEIEHL